jgi:hypothetical protein
MTPVLWLKVTIEMFVCMLWCVCVSDFPSAWVAYAHVYVHNVFVCICAWMHAPSKTVLF